MSLQAAVLYQINLTYEHYYTYYGIYDFNEGPLTAAQHWLNHAL